MKTIRLSGSTMFILGVCRNMLKSVLGDEFEISRMKIVTTPVDNTQRFAVRAEFLIKSHKNQIFTGPRQIRFVADFGIWGNNGNIDGSDDWDWQILPERIVPCLLAAFGEYTDGFSCRFTLGTDSRLHMVDKPLDLSPHYL